MTATLFFQIQDAVRKVSRQFAEDARQEAGTHVESPWPPRSFAQGNSQKQAVAAAPPPHTTLLLAASLTLFPPAKWRSGVGVHCFIISRIQILESGNEWHVYKAIMRTVIMCHELGATDEMLAYGTVGVNKGRSTDVECLANRTFDFLVSVVTSRNLDLQILTNRC